MICPVASRQESVQVLPVTPDYIFEDIIIPATGDRVIELRDKLRLATGKYQLTLCVYLNTDWKFRAPSIINGRPSVFEATFTGTLHVKNTKDSSPIKIPVKCTLTHEKLTDVNGILDLEYLTNVFKGPWPKGKSL